MFFYNITSFTFLKVFIGSPHDAVEGGGDRSTHLPRD